MLYDIIIIVKMEKKEKMKKKSFKQTQKILEVRACACVRVYACALGARFS